LSDSQEQVMRLRRSILGTPGIARKRRGIGIACYGPDGRPVADPETLQRIKEQVIQPRGTMCGYRRIPTVTFRPTGWTRRRAPSISITLHGTSREEVDRVLRLSAQLPAWRAAIAKDLSRNGLTRKRVSALA
jgi:hypothetical protein